MKKLISIILVIAAVIGCTVAFTACNNVGDAKVKVIDIELTTEQYAFGINKENTDLLAQVNEIMESKKSEIEAIKSQYLNATQEELDGFGSEEIATNSADRNSEFIVVTNLDFAPFEYKNGNKIAGIDMEIAQLLADGLGKTLVVIDMKFDAVVTNVQTQPANYDIAIAGLTIAPDRAEQIDFTIPYYDTTQVLIVKSDDATFDEIASSDKSAEDKTTEINELLTTLTGEKAKCGGQRGTTSQYYVEGGLEYAGFGNLAFSAYDNAGQAVMDMTNGNIAFVIVDKAVANAIAATINA